MTASFKPYLRDRIKAALLPIICLTVAAVVITLFAAIPSQRTEYPGGTGSRVFYYCTLEIPVTLMVILCYLAPVLAFSPFKKRRNLDCFYALPISRQGLAAVHYLTGLAALVIPFTLSYLTNFLLLLRFASRFNLAPVLGHYFLTLIFGAVIYSVFVFVFNEANTVVDGIWFMILYSFILGLAILCIESYMHDLIRLTAGYGAIWAPIAGVTSLISHAVNGTSPSEYGADYSHAPIWYAVWVVLAIAAAVGFFLTFGKRRVEKTEALSDSYFGFRTLIPVYAVTGMLLFHSSHEPIYWLIIEVLAATGYTIFRRGFHYKKSDLIILAALTVFLVI